MIHVIDKFLPTSLATKLLVEVEDNNFPWYFLKNSINSQEISYAKYPLLVHTLYYNGREESHFSSAFTPILYFIEDRFNVNIIDINRIKINCLLKTETSHMYVPHTDTDMPGYTTFVYYLNTSDGFTNIYNEKQECNDPGFYETDSHLTLVKQIQPTHNSILRFDSNQYHSYTTPVQSDRRFIVNMVVKLQ